MTKQTGLRALWLIVLVGLIAWIVTARYKPAPIPMVPGDELVMSVILDNGQEHPIDDVNFPIAFSELSTFTLQSSAKLSRLDRFFSITPADLADYRDLTKDRGMP